MTKQELKYLSDIQVAPGQYFVFRDITWPLLKKKLIRTDSGGYLRITPAGEEILIQKTHDPRENKAGRAEIGQPR